MKHRYLTIYCTHCGKSFNVPERCGNRFCEVCSGARRRRMINHITEIMARVRTSKQSKLRLVTFTMPSSDDPRRQYKDLVASFRRLRQRVWWKRRVNGGLSFFEVTHNAKAGWHVHLHIIALSKWLPQKELSAQFVKCGGGPICDVRLMYNKNVAGYVTKYALKTTLPEDLQVKASKALAGSRLYQPFGKFHNMAIITKPKPSSCGSCGCSEFMVVLPGMSLFEALNKFPDAFPPVIRSTIVPNQAEADQLQLDVGKREHQL